jgi:iron complex outermembrane recepter protein
MWHLLASLEGRIRRTLEWIGRVACLIALVSVVASAQTGGQLSGAVRDTTGSVLPAVMVTVTGAALTAPRTVVTDEHGEYVVDALSTGRYLVTAAFSGFESSSSEIEVGATPAMLNLVLAVSSLAERVTVTATRTGASDVQSTPAAITVLQDRTLEELGAETIEALAGVVPAVTISQHTGLAQVTIRGIGTNSTFGDPSSTVHLDGVYLGRPAMVFADFLNIERVEVLRGPQGTLYGRNSVGGTINIVTRQPTNTLETSLRLTAGNYHKLRAEGAVSGPLIKNKVMGNFAFLRGTREGFVHDLDHPDHSLGSEDTWAGRGRLRIVLGAQSELLLSGDHGRFDGVPLTYAKPIARKTDFSVPFDSPGSLWTVRTSDVTSGKNVQQGASAKLAVRLNGTTTLTSLTAYRRSNYRFFIDADATELQLQTSDVPDVQRQVSEELTLVQRTPKLTWIGGVFFFDEHTEGQVEITVYPAVQSRLFAKIGTKARALFGQATYRLSRRVSLTAGVRYTDEQKDLDNTGGVYRLGMAVLADLTSFYDYVDHATYQAWTPKGSLQAQVSRDTFVYVSATRGFKSGGFNQFNPTAPEPERAFNPEFAWSFEGGLKRTMADGRVRVNTAMFSNDYRDLQVQSFLRPGVIDISNAGSAIIRGIEVEAVATAWRGLQLAGHVSWLDATYDRYIARGPGGTTRDAAGNRLNNAPEWSGSGSAVYELATGRTGTTSVRGEVSWQSRVFFTPVNDTIETQRAYGRVHLRAGFEPPSRRWEIAVYVRNAANRDYITGTANVPIPAITGRPGEPRHWGTQLTLRR